MNLETMSLKQKIGQLIVAGFPSETMSEEFVQLVKEHKIANTILFSYNTPSEEKVEALCDSIQKLVKEETGGYAFITIDQEGGVVTRLPKESVNIPGAMALAQIGDKEKAYEAALLTGYELKRLGINFNLAPVLDINSNPDNPVIGVRSFGSDSKVVTEYGCKMVRGYLDAGIMCSLKHFPGHGDTTVDSHLSLPCITKDYTELEQEELVPFQEAMKCGATAVTLAHILFPKIENEKIPATMSEKIIQGIVRKKFGFQGLVISDCLEMNAIKEYFGTAVGAKNAIKAGVDMIFISHTASLVVEAIKEIEEAVISGEIPISRIDDAVRRIITYKEIYANTKTDIRIEDVIKDKVRQDRKEYVKELFQESIQYRNREKGYCHKIGKLPLFLSCGAYRSTMASSDVEEELLFSAYMQDRFGGEAVSFTVNPDCSEIVRIMEKATSKHYTNLILGTYNGHLNRGQIMLAKELEGLKISMLMVALRNPYDLDEVSDAIDKIAAFEYSEQSFEGIVPLICRC